MDYIRTAPWGYFPPSRNWSIRESCDHLRTIGTARTIEEINDAVSRGFFPLLEWLVPSEDVFDTVCGLLADNLTGEMSLDMRRHAEYQPAPDGTRRVLQGHRYYPYQFPSPFAAYLIPKDLQVGELVWLEDLIADIPALLRTVEKNVSRIPSAPAIWRDGWFDIQYIPEEEDYSGWVG